MKKILSLISITVLVVYYFLAISSNSETVKVLYIGNSLTSANNLPRMVSDIAKSHGYKMFYDSYTPGGSRLANHASNPKVLKKIKEKPWDFVVLQEQSQYSEFSKKQLSRDVFPYAKRLAKAVRNANDKTNVVFYMTMARRNGDPDNKNISSELLTYEGMQKRVNRCYLEMGKSNGALVAPVGAVWKRIRQEKPNFNLYSDNIHPNKNGTYLAASVFYATFFGKTTFGSYIPYGVNPEFVSYIHEIIDKIFLK